MSDATSLLDRNEALKTNEQISPETLELIYREKREHFGNRSNKVLRFHYDRMLASKQLQGLHITPASTLRRPRRRC